MKKIFATASLAVLLSGAAAAVDFKSDDAKINYMVGSDVGRYLKASETKFDEAAFIKGVKDAMAGKEIALTDDELKQVRTVMQKKQQAAQAKMREEQMKKFEAAKKENLEKGKAFLAKKAKDKKVKKTASGLMYEVLKEGSGKQPKSPEDTVVVHYKGTTIDGKEFDSSYKRGQPATFKLNQVIKGWTEGVQLMKEGAKYRFYIPADLAYGENAPPAIGPNQVLIFDVELLEVKDTAKDAVKK